MEKNVKKDNETGLTVRGGIKQYVISIVPFFQYYAMHTRSLLFSLFSFF